MHEMRSALMITHALTGQEDSAAADEPALLNEPERGPTPAPTYGAVDPKKVNQPVKTHASMSAYESFV